MPGWQDLGWQEAPVGTLLAGTSHCSRCTLHSSQVVIHTWGSGPLVLTALPFWPNLCTTVHPVKPPTSAFALPTQLQSRILLVFKWLVPSGLLASVSIKCWFLASHPRALRDADSGGPAWHPENTLVTSTRGDPDADIPTRSQKHCYPPPSTSLLHCSDLTSWGGDGGEDVETSW